VVEDGALVGMGAIVCQRAHLGAGAMLAAGAVLAERASISPGMLGAGVPASEKKELSGSAKGWTEHAAAEYQQLRRRYLTGARVESLENAPA
jgi:carbonic anhydrase/acetyltransferase-like protein (isoleucine patch superfamily)